MVTTPVLNSPEYEFSTDARVYSVTIEGAQLNIVAKEKDTTNWESVGIFNIDDFGQFAQGVNAILEQEEQRVKYLLAKKEGQS